MDEPRSSSDETSLLERRASARRRKDSVLRGRKRLLLWLSLGCVVVGVACMGWAIVNIRAGTLAGTPAVSTSEIVASATAAPALPSTVTAGTAAPKETASLRRASFAKNPSQGDLIGSLSIPALKKSWPIIEGTRTSDLKKGVGHYVKSVLPGDKDNCVLSAHRDTFFASLGDVKKGDRLTVETANGTFNYEVTGTRIVGKNDRTVIVPTGHGVLTLTTCYPFDYVGSAPKRYIVSADLVP